MEALLSGFQRVVCRLALPSNRWLKRPTPNASRRYPPFKSSTAARSCSYGLFPWAALLASLSAKKYATAYFSARNRTSKYSRSCSFVAELLSLGAACSVWCIRPIRYRTPCVVSRQRFHGRSVTATLRMVVLQLWNRRQLDTVIV